MNDVRIFARTGERLWARPTARNTYLVASFPESTAHYTEGDEVAITPAGVVRKVITRNRRRVLVQYGRRQGTTTCYYVARDHLLQHGALSVVGLMRGLIGATFPAAMDEEQIAGVLAGLPAY